MRLKKTALGALSVAALVGSSLAIGATSAGAEIVDKVTICHATNSNNNPYVQEEPNANGDVSGHADHTGPVWNPTLKAQHISWGDIIPPFDWSGGSFPGLNWDAAGQAIYDNECVPTTPGEFGSVAVAKVVVDPDGVATPGASYSIHLLCTLESATVVDENVSVQAGATSAAFGDVPSGSSCDATEDTSGLSNLVSAVSDGPVTIATDGDSVVTVTNTFAATPPAVVPAQVSPAQAAVAPVVAPVVAPAAVQVTPRTTG